MSYDSLAHLNEGTPFGVKTSLDFLFCPFYYCFDFGPLDSSNVILLERVICWVYTEADLAVSYKVTQTCDIQSS